MKIQAITFSEIKAPAFANPKIFVAYFDARREDLSDNALVIEAVELIIASSSNVRKLKK